jgi:hypothetical protein
LKTGKLSRKTLSLVHTINQIASTGICERRSVCQEFLLVTIAIPWQVPFVVNGSALPHSIAYESHKIILGNCVQRLLDHLFFCSVDPQYTLIVSGLAQEKAHDPEKPWAGGDCDGQYSSGSRNVVTLRSASVIIQNFTPVLSV